MIGAFPPSPKAFQRLEDGFPKARRRAARDHFDWLGLESAAFASWAANMGLFKHKGKARARVFDIQVACLTLWSNEGPLLVEWRRGKSKGGVTAVAEPSQRPGKSITKYTFNETLSIEATLYEVRPAAQAGGYISPVLRSWAIMGAPLSSHPSRQEADPLRHCSPPRATSARSSSCWCSAPAVRAPRWAASP